MYQKIERKNLNKEQMVNSERRKIIERLFELFSSPWKRGVYVVFRANLKINLFQ